MAQKMVQYLAEDGTPFATEAEANAHDAVMKKDADITAFSDILAKRAGKSERAGKNFARILRDWEGYQLLDENGRKEAAEAADKVAKALADKKDAKKKDKEAGKGKGSAAAA